MVFKKRVLGLLFVFFLFLSLSFVSGQTVIKDDWFEHDESFLVGSDLYRLTLLSDGVLWIRKNDLPPVNLDLGDCKTVESMFEYCYVNNSYDIKVDIDSKGELQPGVRIKLVDHDVTNTVKVSISSSISGNKFLYDDYEAKITVKNTGDSSIGGAELIIKVPDDVMISNERSFSFIQDTLKNSVSLAEGRDGEYFFNYRVLSTGVKRLEYELVDGDKSLKKGTFSVSGVLPYSYKITNPTKMDINQIGVFEVVIKNNHPEDSLDVSELSIKGPVNFQYLSTQSLSASSVGFYSGSKTSISSGSEKTFSIRYRPLFVGSYSFSFLASIIRDDDVFDISDSKNVSVVSDGLSGSLYFNRNDISLGADTNLVLSLKNDHSSLSFRNINVVVESDLFNASKAYDFIGSGDSVEFFNEKILVPQVRENKEYVVNAFVTYFNDANQLNSFNLTDTLKVTGNGSLVRITQKVSPKKVSAGDEIIVEIIVRNLKDNPLNVVVEDSFSQAVEMVSGSPSGSLSLGANQEKTAYLYKIRIPEKPSNKDLNLTSKVSIDSLDYELTALTKVVVEGDIFLVDADFDVEVGEDVVSDSDESTQESSSGSVKKGASSDKEDGFLKRLVQNLDDFFSNLFKKK